MMPSSGSSPVENQTSNTPHPNPIPNGPIVGLGEALFDCFESHRTLGGAPLNATLVAHSLGTPWGIRGQMVSRVGTDELGKEILAELDQRQVDTTTIQLDPAHPTGTVQVEMQDGEPQYDIVRDVAWDHLHWDHHLQTLAQQASGITFGSLAQRSNHSRETIQRFLQEATQAVKLFDVNLRGNFYDADSLEQSCNIADAVKLNRDELTVVTRTLQLECGKLVASNPTAAAHQFREHFRCRAVILTHGSRGTQFLTDQGQYTADVPSFDPEPGSDPVGAGDACGATCLLGLILRWQPQQIVARANRVGAFVASRRGATPQLDPAPLLEIL